MSKIDQTFKRLRKEGRAALVPFIVAGDPDLETTEPLVLKMAQAGADLIELGLPFSDPIADGPTIQAAYKRALQKGVGLRDIFHLTERLKRTVPPLVLMTYFNPILRYGLKKFAVGCKEYGIDGVIIPDLPPEEARSWSTEAQRMDLDTIFLIAPTSPPERIRLVSRYSRGFIYYVSITGVTGAREKLPEELEIRVGGIRNKIRKPVAVGFGISTPEQAKEVRRFADGIIVGSAIVKIIEENLKNPEMIAKAGDFVSSLANALNS
jgi:tryptophan synthase alpha chain